MKRMKRMKCAMASSKWWRPAVAGAALAGAFLCERPAAAAPVDVPQAWLGRYGLAAADADNTASNGMKVWECFVAGLDPKDPAARFAIRIDTEKAPFLSWTPDLATDRVYTVEARTNLADSGWVLLTNGVPQTLAAAEAAGLRFFRVKAAMPEGGEPPDEKRYLVVDLSGGKSASSYPVSYLPGIPAGGWTEEYKTTKLVMRKIRPGTFMMGSPEGELGRNANETPHEVTLTKPFYIGVFEVTQKQWELVTGKNPSAYAHKGACRPVENLKYNDICNGGGIVGYFMRDIRKKASLAGFNLPTEAQWEYACRAGTTTALNTGKDLSSKGDTGPCAEMDEAGRYAYNGGMRQNENGKWLDVGSADVGSYLANAWGLYDMHGNVREWCLDWYGTYPSGAVTDPAGAKSGSQRVARGGAWNSHGYSCRSAHRGGGSPKSESKNFGFRLVCLSEQ